MGRPRIGVSSRNLALAASVLMTIVALTAVQGFAALGQEPAPPIRAAQNEENITLDVPAGVALTVRGNTVVLRQKSRADAFEYEISGGASLSWSNGIKLNVRNAKLTMVRAEKNGPIRIYIRP